MTQKQLLGTFICMPDIIVVSSVDQQRLVELTSAEKRLSAQPFTFLTSDSDEFELFNESLFTDAFATSCKHIKLSDMKLVFGFEFSPLKNSWQSTNEIILL